VDIPIAEGPLGASIPFLFLRDGEVSIFALAWSRHHALYEFTSPAEISASIQAIGLFYDFYYLVERGRPVSAEDLGRVLARFMEAREHGTAELRWDAVQRKTAIDDVRRISAFGEFCANNFGHVPLNQRETKFVEDLNFSDQRRFYFALERRKEWDKLAHLVNSSQAGQGKVSRAQFAPKLRRIKASYERKTFPPDKVLPLINATPSVRDRLYLILLFFGGLRSSEPLHLFVTDITVDPTGSAVVTLGHPETGSYEWTNLHRGKQYGNRATFLAERYSLGPRNKLGKKHPRRAGWKGMAYDRDSRKESYVNWLVPEMGRYFARLHFQYMQETRKHVRDEHPYYFVNEKDDRNFGSPLTLSNTAKMFKRAARRLGLEPDEEGVNRHGGRHFYGYFCASHLRLPLEVTQTVMHHASILSTKIYYALDQAVARDELKKGFARIQSELPSFCADIERISFSGHTQ
jgi:integrase